MGIVPKGIPSSENTDFIQTAWQLQSESAIYPASVDDNATVFWLHDCQAIIPLASLKKYSVMDWRLMESAAQSESVYTNKPLLDRPS